MKFGSILLATTLAGGSARRLGDDTRRLNEDTFIFETVTHGSAQATTANISAKVGKSCSTDDRWVHFVDDEQGDYIDIATTKWHSGGYRMDCVDKGSHTGWQCWASCSPVRCYISLFSLTPHGLFSHNIICASSLCTRSFPIQISWSGVT